MSDVHQGADSAAAAAYDSQMAQYVDQGGRSAAAYATDAAYSNDAYSDPNATHSTMQTDPNAAYTIDPNATYSAMQTDPNGTYTTMQTDATSSTTARNGYSPIGSPLQAAAVYDATAQQAVPQTSLDGGIIQGPPGIALQQDSPIAGPPGLQSVINSQMEQADQAHYAAAAAVAAATITTSAEQFGPPGIVKSGESTGSIATSMDTSGDQAQAGTDIDGTQAEWPQQQGSNFVYDESSGYYYDAASGYYYDSTSGLYIHGETHVYYRWDDATQGASHSRINVIFSWNGV